MNDVIAQIDAEIARLQQAKALLGGATAAVKSGRGRPKGSKNSATKQPTATVAAPAKTAAKTAAKSADKTAEKGKRKLSPEGRKAIADAMKRRWAERRKQPAK